MGFWTNLIIVTHVLVALAIIGLVLRQHGKGADMGSGFGGGASSSLFGATGSANFLSRATAVLATIFFILRRARAAAWSIERSARRRRRRRTRKKRRRTLLPRRPRARRTERYRSEFLGDNFSFAAHVVKLVDTLA